MVNKKLPLRTTHTTENSELSPGKIPPTENYTQAIHIHDHFHTGNSHLDNSYRKVVRVGVTQKL